MKLLFGQPRKKMQ